MRLIDADNLVFNGRQYNSSQMKAILDFVDAQPTAYNPDKAVEQLEKEFKKYYGENWNKAPYLVKAIEIVKAGGTDES